MRLAALVLALAALPGTELAQQEKSVGGLTVNLGHRDAHPATFPSGSQHILITVAESRGGTVEKPLLRTQAAGQPDYSELFVFGWGGKYSLRVRITPPGAKTSETTFSVGHRI